MVFRLFGRSKGPPEPGLNAADEAHRTQLRTPSPSASVSAGTAPPQSPEVAPDDAVCGVKRSRSTSPNPPHSATDMFSGDAPVPPPANPAELLTRVKKIPPKVLHTYVVTHLPHAPLEVSEVLMTFFASLAPPPKLHCVRCHKDYVEVENTDRSCLVPHDDESAEVEYVGNSKSKVAGVVGTTYETLWGCCNKVVEGDGDQGPPDGWCFEGFHTTDVKRARFRADSTVHDDKLTSCARKRCFNSGADSMSAGRGRSQRAAARKSLREASDEEEDYDERELVREAQALANGSDAGESGSASAKKKTPKNRKRKSDAMDLEAEGDGDAERESITSAPVSAAKPRGKSKAEGMKPKSATKTKQNVEEAASPARPSLIPTNDADVEMTAPKSESKPKLKKPRKPRKSSGADGGKYVPPKVGEESSDFDEAEDKPKRKKARRKSTMSVAAVPT